MSVCFFWAKKELSPVSSLFVAYEDLVRGAVGQLRSVMGFVGSPLDAAQLHWRSGEHCDIRSNGMGFGTCEQTRLDRKWAFELSWSEKLSICLWTILFS